MNDDNQFVWWDDVSEEAIAGILAEALSRGHTSFWLQVSLPEFTHASTPIVIGTAKRPSDPEARRYVYLDEETGWVRA
jgi:hypothetical protein